MTSRDAAPVRVRVLFLRHGETQHNIEAIISSGDPGMPLTEIGRQQARDTARRVATLGPRRVVSSPLLRARQTADIVASGLGMKVEHDRDLRECGVGELEGKGGPESFAIFDGALRAWHLEGRLDVALGPRGETGHEVGHRFVAAVDRATREAGDGDAVVIVCHQTIMLFGIAVLCDNLRPEETHRRFIPNLGAIEVNKSKGAYRCVSWAGSSLPLPSGDSEA